VTNATARATLDPMRTLRLLPALALGVLSAAACAKQEASGLTIALGTDLVVPDDINAVAIVLTNAETGSLLAAPLINPTVPSAEGRAVRFPATLALETAFENDGSTFSFRRGARKVSTVQIALVGLKGPTADQAAKDGAAVTLRRVVTSMPESGTHLLRLHLGVLDLGGASGTAATLGQLASGAALVPAGRVQPALTVFGDVQTTCADPEQNLVDGACSAPPVLDGEALPLFDPAQVFGGAPAGSDDRAQCFDIPKCLADATPVVLDADGSVPTAGAKGFALVRAEALTTAGSNAVCLGDGAARRCFAPLDEPELGTTGAYSVDANGVAHFGAGVVAALKSGKIRGLVATSCAKTAGLPICAPWSSVVGTNNRFANDAGPAPDATVDASIDTGIDATIDSGIDADAAFDGGTPDASDAGADAGPPFLPVQSFIRLGTNDGRRISDFVIELENGGFKDAVVTRETANGQSTEVASVTTNATNPLALTWPLGTPPFPAARVVGRLAPGPIVFLSRDVATAYRVRAAPLRDAGGIVTGLNGGEASPNGACLFAGILGPTIFNSGTNLLYSRDVDGYSQEIPVFQNGSFAATAGAALPDLANNRFRVLLGGTTGDRFPLDVDLAGSPPQLANASHVSPGLVAGAVRGVAAVPPNFWISQTNGNGDLALREVSPDDAPTGREWVVPNISWDFNGMVPAPGMAAVSAGGASYLFAVVPDGIVAYDTKTSRPAGYVVRANGFEARKMVAEGGCVYFALWSSVSLNVAGGMFGNPTPGLYQVCLQ